MKYYLSTLIQVAPSLIEDYIRYKIGKGKSISLPKKIKGYTLTKNLTSGYSFVTGAYKGPNGKKVVIKYWEGKRKDIHRHALVHEITVMRTISQVQSKLSAGKKSRVRVPNFITSVISDTQVYLMTEHIIGEPISLGYTPSEQWDIYSKCMDFLAEVSKKCSKTDREKITVKTIYDFLFLYPFLLAGSMLRHPELSLKLLRGMPIFLTGVPHLLRMKPTALVHGDLHPNNILASHGRFYLLDLEQLRFCYPEYESVISLSLKSNSSNFKEIIMKHLLLTIDNNYGKLKAVAALMINNATHCLTNDPANHRTASYIHAFDIGIRLSRI